MLRQFSPPSIAQRQFIYIERVCGVLCLLIILSSLGLAGCMPESKGRKSPDKATAMKQLSSFEELLESVVRIDVWEATYQRGAKRLERGQGSGVIMTPEGHILTNAHVVNGYAEKIMVTLPNLERVSAHLVGWDHWTDLALIQLDAKEVARKKIKFYHASFAKDVDIEPGTIVYAVGTPYGLNRTVTRGIISNTNRFFESRDTARGFETGMFNTWYQTDAAINPGNSGGALALPDGAVVGINSRAVGGDANNLGFAVPYQIAEEVMNKILESQTGQIERSYVGIVPGTLQDLEEYYNLEFNRGVLINSVNPGSPAYISGLQAGDLILEIDGDPVDGRFPEQLPPIQKKIADYPVGSIVIFKVERNEELHRVPVRTEFLQSRIGVETAFEEWGLTVRKVSRPIAREKRLPNDDGVVVIGTQTAFPADVAGLMPGDIILKVNHYPIEKLEDLEEVYHSYVRNPKKVLLEVMHGHQISFYVLKPS